VDLTRYVDELNHQLAVAADAGGEEARLLAERLVAPLESATRLVLLDALSDAAGEITAELAPGSVEVRLRGRDPEFVVTPPPPDPPDGTATAASDLGLIPPAVAAGDGDEGGTSRVTLRLPEPLKLRMEEAAAREALSLNSWLVRTLNGAMQPSAAAGPTPRRTATGGDRVTGWAQS
jgi:hypothetical protein